MPGAFRQVLSHKYGVPMLHRETANAATTGAAASTAFVPDYDVTIHGVEASGMGAALDNNKHVYLLVNYGTSEGGYGLSHNQYWDYTTHQYTGRIEFEGGIHCPSGSSIQFGCMDPNEGAYTLFTSLIFSRGFNGPGTVSKPREHILWMDMYIDEILTDKSGGAGSVSDSLQPAIPYIWEIYEFKMSSTSNLQRRVYSRGDGPGAISAVDMVALPTETATSVIRYDDGAYNFMDSPVYCTQNSWWTLYHDSANDGDFATRYRYRIGVLPR